MTRTYCDRCKRLIFSNESKYYFSQFPEKSVADYTPAVKTYELCRNCNTSLKAFLENADFFEATDIKSEEGPF